MPSEWGRGRKKNGMEKGRVSLFLFLIRLEYSKKASSLLVGFSHDLVFTSYHRLSLWQQALHAQTSDPTEQILELV